MRKESLESIRCLPPKQSLSRFLMSYRSTLRSSKDHQRLLCTRITPATKRNRKFRLTDCIDWPVHSPPPASSQQQCRLQKRAVDRSDAQRDCGSLDGKRGNGSGPCHKKGLRSLPGLACVQRPVSIAFLDVRVVVPRERCSRVHHHPHQTVLVVPALPHPQPH